MSDCKICDDILLRFTDTSTRHEINLGSFDEALSSRCPRHTRLIRAFKDVCSGSGDGPRGSEETTDVGFIERYEGDPMLDLTESISKLGTCWALLLKSNSGLPDHTRVGRVLNPDWVDLDTVKEWKQMCLSQHGEKCRNPMKILPTSPAWLVDTGQRCIVSGEGQNSYVALSYRWGEASGFRMDEEILERLQKESSLDDPDILDRLPLTVRHAISLVPSLDERYLWVDCLCIVHGGHASTAEQLNLMSAIYASATLTIIAADGDSSNGLLGLKGISPSRNFEQRIFPFGDETLIVRNSATFSMMSGTEYYERAWSYQEFTMSPRKLLFNRKEIHWECRCAVWHEELTPGTEIDQYIDPGPGVMLAGFPDLTSFGRGVADYNRRLLSYDEDALSGFAGYLSVQSRSFKGGFLYGCPEMFFDRALGWKPQWNFTNLRRRVPSDRPPADRVASTALPSWSWIGWSGMVTLQHGEASRVNDRCSYIEETIPITEWYTSSSPCGQPRRRIHSTWFEDRDSYKSLANDPSKTLPNGWTRHEASEKGTFRDEPRLYPDKCARQVFKHRDMPPDDCQEWYYPFSVAEITESTPFFTPAQTAFLFCKTKMARMWTDRADYEESHGEVSHLLKFRQEKGGKVIGRLHLQNEEQLEAWPGVNEEVEGAGGRTIDVVAIYENVKYSKTFSSGLKRYSYPVTREERVTVLWVDRKEEVAYRMACGYIDKEAWEGLDLEEIDLVLG